jgi:hypothetical protein
MPGKSKKERGGCQPPPCSSIISVLEALPELSRYFREAHQPVPGPMNFHDLFMIHFRPAKFTTTLGVRHVGVASVLPGSLILKYLS